MLAARTADGQQLTPVDIAREMHHGVLAGFIVFAELAAILVELNRNPSVRDKLAVEVTEHIGDDAIEAKKMRAMSFLRQVSQETKRFTKNVPFAFWVAKRDFEYRGYSIKKGWGLLICTTETTQMSEYWTDPERFDLDRFGPERDEEGKNPNAFIPQGAGPITGHRCLGTHFSTYVMEVFATLLVRDYTWKIPEQDLSLKLEQVTPEQRSGLIVDVTRK
jgi:cytochrome P450